jgi:hypothetical protein
MISFLSPIEKPYEIYQERILCEGSYKVCECSGGVVAIISQYGCTVRSSIAAFRVADPGFKSRPEHFFYILLVFVPSHTNKIIITFSYRSFFCLLAARKTDFLTLSCFFCSYYNTRDLPATLLLGTIHVKPLAQNFDIFKACLSDAVKIMFLCKRPI